MQILPRSSTTAAARRNPVGRLLLHLFKRTNESNCRASDAVCSALQLVNFWQDVDVDYGKDERIYLPQDEMARHGVTEQHLSRKVCDDAWQALMKFQVDRTRKLMLSGAIWARPCPAASAWRSAPPSRAACASWRRSSAPATTCSAAGRRSAPSTGPWCC